MNKGKICVSVCAETADELIEQIKRADDSADVIEIRFDCLSENEFKIADSKETEKVLRRILVENAVKSEIILTFRPKDQGGWREMTKEARYDFWASGYDSWGADLEEEIFDCSRNWLYEPRICSHHDFDKVPENLNQIYQRIKNTDLVDVIKIAVQTKDMTDSIAVWKLLETAKSDNRKIIPIAMGESGRWTRILGLAHGALMSYAALDAGKETAPGQVSARDLIEVYRAQNLNENTDVYGVLGSNTGVSMSPYMHNAAFRFHDLNAVFVPLQVHDLDAFIRRMVAPETREVELNFKGFAVTIPHKQNIIKHLDSIDETAERIGAVNTVKIIEGKMHGYNTDAQGFIEPLLNSYGDLKNAKVAVLGAGGAARACVDALKNQDAKVTIFARDLKKAELLAEDFQVECESFRASHSAARTYEDFDILVNTTPLGMKGATEGETPATAEQLRGLDLVYDLVYTPFRTALMREADRAEIPKIGGLAMLVAQATEQQKIWTGRDAPMKEMSRAVLERLQ